MTTRIVELRQGILKKNDELARELRERFEAAGVLVLNLVSSPGTGKTALLERTREEGGGAGGGSRNRQRCAEAGGERGSRPPDKHSRDMSPRSRNGGQTPGWMGKAGTRD